jgi:DNA (cytosine-5)-methyltransferase 1
MVHGSLFSGFDAPSVAASWMGWENAFHCEINDFCNEILKYWFPNSEHYEDITKTDFSQWRGRIDILTGGFPCQPFSVAGQRKGADDNRYLWPHMLRAIREIRPTWVIGENVAGILTMVQPGEETEMGSQTSIFGEDNRKRVLLRQEYVVETICKDLEREGYSVQPMLIPACAVGAPHRRDRVWFVAHCSDARIEKMQRERTDGVLSNGIATYTNGNGHLSCKPSGKTEECWRSNFPQPEKWRNTSEWVDGLSGLSQDVADSQCTGSGQIHEEVQPEKPDGDCVDCNGSKRNVTYSNSKRLEELKHQQRSMGEKNKRKQTRRINDDYLQSNWANFPTQSPVCRGNDGLPFDVGDLTIPFTKWRQESVKGYGNAIVPQVIFEIFKAIEEVEQLG